ncbi:tensin-2 [Spea bombifrons]|uniref:tensin-2 n=1 Tax=Spea bombifrons TaxID=233779 RepID=UPI00234A3A84|nr:tensin-2 [Spea bombifrons]
MGCAGSCAVGGQTAGHSKRTMHLTEPASAERHVFQEKALKKKKACAACNEPVVSQGSVCRVCKIASHKKCEGKVPIGCSSPPPADMRRRTAPGPTIQHMGSNKSLKIKQRSSLPRNFSLDQVIQRSYDLDLTYITERIISVFFPTNLEEQRYRSNLREVASMLRSKHDDKYLLFNLSRKRHDITRLNPKVQDFYWPDCHAPPLDIICSICKAMEAWLNSDPQHVVVLHCKGNQGKTGVVIASYMHYSKVSASVDQALSTLAMRKFCEDKVSMSLHPSQRRYINYFGGLLSGNIKISSDMLSLQCILLPVIPALQTEEGFCPFLKIYQSMQLVYTSGIYSSHRDVPAQKRQLCINLEPALLLKGDIMVKCYHKHSQPHEREVIFRLQFHTCTIHNTHLCFSKDQLDCACTDDRFPEGATVEFIFSSGNEKTKGREIFLNDPAVSVDYDITDPLVRYDSYENLNVHHEDSLEDLSHTRGPLDGSLYARVKKRSTPLPSSNGSPEHHGRLLSVSSDSGHSSAPTERLEETPQKPLPTAAEREDLERLLGGFGVMVKQDVEPQYSQVIKHEETGTQNGNQQNNLDERPRDLHNFIPREIANQNTQAKVNGEARRPYSPGWSRAGDERTSRNLPLTSSSWEGQREAPCETQWGTQRDCEMVIMEEEIGQLGGLVVYPERRQLLSRHCSCRLGYAPPNIEGPPSRSYFRPEGLLDPRGAPGPAASSQNANYPGMYNEQDRRRLYRSLSEGPQHYHTQSPPKRGSLRDTRPYMRQGPPHEPLLLPLCPCSHCQSSACYSVPNMWPLEGTKMPTMQPYHHGEHPLHLAQTYGQSVQPSHDIPNFQMPQAKMHYGYPTPHGEDALHFGQFAEGGYGPNYPHFLHPSYLPNHCTPSYNTPSFPTCVSPYSLPGGHSSPGSVSPVAPMNTASRRMSDDTISAGSTGEQTPPHHPNQELGINDQQADNPSSQPQAHREAMPIISTAAIIQTNSVAQGSLCINSHSPGHTNSSPYANGLGRARSPVQTDGYVYPQNPIHTSTPINTYSQTQHNNVHTQHAANQRPSVQADCPAGKHTPSSQYSPVHTQSSLVQTHDPHAHMHSPVHTNSAPVHTNSKGNTKSSVRFQTPELTQANSYVMKCDQPAQMEKTVQTHSSSAHSNLPVHTHSSPVPPHSPVYTQSSSTNTHSPGHMQGSSFHPHTPGHTLNSTIHACSSVHGQSSSAHSLETLQSSPVHNQVQVHKQSLISNSHFPGHMKPAQTNSSGNTHNQSPVHVQSSQVSPASPGHAQSSQVSPASPGHAQSSQVSPASPGHAQSSQVSPQSPGHVQSSHVSPQSPGHTQSSQVSPQSPGHTQRSHVSPQSPGHTQSSQVSPASPGHAQSSQVSPQSPGHVQSSLVSPQSPGHVHSSQVSPQSPGHVQSSQVSPQFPANTQSSPAQTHSPGHMQSSPVNPHSPEDVQIAAAQTPTQSPMCTDTLHDKLSTVHTSKLVQKDSTSQTTITVRTQMSSGSSHNSGLKVGPSGQMHNTVRTQSVSMQTFRNPGNQDPSVQINKPMDASNQQGQTSNAPGTDRPGLSVSCEDVPIKHLEEKAVMALATIPSNVIKVAPQFSANPRTKSLEAIRGQFSFGPIITSNEEISSDIGGSYPSLLHPDPKNSITAPKRSLTVSLPMSHGTTCGGEATTSPPLTPMGSRCDLLPPSPTPSFPISTAYYTGSPCPPSRMEQPPSLPEKAHAATGRGKTENVDSRNGHPARKISAPSTEVLQDAPLTVSFVQDTSRFWYKPNISREQAITLLRGAEPGCFLIRDSNSFRGAYGLALKVSSPPPNAVTQPCKDPVEQLIRHFLIETGPKGVKIKGSPIEPYFGSLSALVSQHSVTPLSLPCRLRVPCRDLAEQNSEVLAPTNMSTAADLLRQGAACSVLFLGSVDTESLTGPQAISKASTAILTPPRSSATTVHFKVSEQGITLTDSQRKLFFRRHYPVSSVTFCSADPQDRRWTNPDRTTSKVFGFVARKPGTAAENVCHLFAELDPEQPASAIVNFVTKVMLGTQKR